MSWTSLGSNFGALFSQGGMGIDIDVFNVRTYQQVYETDADIGKWTQSIEFPYSGGTVLTNDYSPETVRRGVDIAYDEFNNDFFGVFTDLDNDIFVVRIDAATGTSSSPTQVFESVGVPAKAIYGASIACGPESITHNCILVWADATSPHELNTMHFFAFPGTDPPELNQTAVQDDWWMDQRPDVAYRGANEFVLAFTLQADYSGRYVTYTAKKGSSPSSQWGTLRSHEYDYGFQSSTIGAANTYAELLINRWP